jgi:hypothetical protein
MAVLSLIISAAPIDMAHTTLSVHEPGADAASKAKPGAGYSIAFKDVARQKLGAHRLA